MPSTRTPRTLLAIPVSLALLVLAPTGPSGSTSAVSPSRGSMAPADDRRRASAPSASSPALTSPATKAALALLVTRGKAQAAAMLARDDSGSRFALAGDGIARSDHFRAGSTTKTFLATVVLQLAAEHCLSLSDTVDEHLPGLVRGTGNDGRRLTLRSLLTHTSGLYDFTADTNGTVPVSPLQAVRIALTHPPADLGRYAYSNYVVLGMVVEQSPAARTPPRPSAASSLPSI